MVNINKLKEIDVLIFGGPGVGKSTLLATIYDQTKQKASSEGNSAKISIVPDRESLVKFSKIVNLLKSACEQDSEIVTVGGIRTTLDFIYEMEIRKPGGTKNDSLKIRFIDTSGEKTIHLDLEEHLKNCRIAILAIDTVELFERNKINAELWRNDTTKIEFLLEQWINHIPNKISNEAAEIASLSRFLCIVPIKTETYMRKWSGQKHVDGGNKIFNQIKKEFDTSLNILKQRKDVVSVVFTPVQTVGNLVFERYKSNGEYNYPIEEWRPIEGEENPYQYPIGYAPMDCDQPLRHILNFFLIQFIRARRDITQTSPSKFFQGLLEALDPDLGVAYSKIRHTAIDFFGQDSHLVSALWEFASKTKSTSPFQIIQGHHLITRDETFL